MRDNSTRKEIVPDCVKHQESVELQDDVDAYIMHGGEIEPVPTNIYSRVCLDNPAFKSMKSKVKKTSNYHPESAQGLLDKDKENK